MSSSSSSRQRTRSKEESLRSKKPSDKRYESKTTERRREEERSRNGKHSSVKQEATSKPSSSPKPPNPLASKSYQSSKHSPSKSSPKPSHRSSPIKLQGGDTKSPGPPLSDHNLSYSKLSEHKSSPKLSHSSKRSDTHAPRRTDSRNSDVHSPKLSDSRSSKSSSSRSKDSNNKDSQRRTTTERRDTKRGSTKPHPLHASHTTSDEEIIEETEQDEREGGVVGLAIDPIPMEEVSEDIPQEEDNNGETDDYLNEEFEEDYEEDFEETSNGSGDEGKREPSSSDIDDVLQAIGQENERVDDQSSQLLNVISPSAPLPPPYLSPRPSMTFSAATQKLKETSIKIKTRGTELSNMIERDTLSINLFELQPLTEYGMYMRSFGQANTSQTGTQTGQDMVEEESQTESITSRDCWTQWPPHDMKGYGRYDDEDGNDSYVEYDTEKLIKFLQKASQVCDVLLEEDELYDANINSIKGREGENRRGDQYCTLESSLTLSGSAKCLTLSSSHSDILVTGSQCKEGGDWIGFLGVWHLSHVQKHPQYALGDQSVPISCCVAFPLVFAGNDDGTVVLWDLRESVSQHKQYSLTNRDIVIRTPTYTTAAMGSGSEGGHTQPVIHVETSGATHDHSTIANDWHVQGLSYQLLSLDASGRVCVWVIVELPEGDPSGSPVDLGLAPGGRVKLVSSATLDTLSGSPIIDAVATGLIVSRADPNTLLIGTDTGAVVRHVRYRPRAVPKKYLMNNLTDSTIISPQVTSVSIHPHFLSYFLVSYSSGHIALYDMHWPHPLITWPPGRQEQVIRELGWHPNLSNVFVCVGGDSEVHIWDLLTDDTGPVHIMKIEKKIVCMKIIANDNESNSSLVVSSLDDVSVFRVESTKLHHANHLELFENFISENTHSM